MSGRRADRRRRARPHGAGRRAGAWAVVALALVAAAPPAVRGQSVESVDLSELGHVVGDPEAPVAVVEFADFACSACALFFESSWPTVKRDLVDRGLVVWRTIPFELGFRRSEEGARAGECAADQERFWRMHDLLFAGRPDWAERGRDTEAVLRGYAAELGLDAERFEECLDDGPDGDRIDRANRAARELGIRGTPTFFVDGMMVQGALPAEALIGLVEGILESRSRGPGPGGRPTPRR